MATDTASTLLVVRRAIAQGTPIVAAWEAVAAHLADGLTADSMEKLQSLDIQSDLDQLENWLREVCESAPPPRGIRGLRFGLFHPAVNDEPSCDFSLTGSQDFDVDSDVWAYDQTYRAPTTPCSTGLHALYPLLEAGLEQGNPALVHICLWYGLLAVAELCRRHSSLLRGRAARRGIAVGFDSGDLIVVGVHSARGFTPFNVDNPPAKPKRQKLLRGDYFRLEGGRGVLLCDCTDNSLPRGLFQSMRPIEPVSLVGTIDPDWPHQRGTLGSLAPFNCDFITAAAARRIEEAFPGEVQFHPLRIEGNADEWRLMNVVQCVKDAYDFHESQRLGRLIVHGAKLTGRNVFFVYGYYEGRAVFLSRAAAQLLIDLDVTGASFVPVATI